MSSSKDVRSKLSTYQNMGSGDNPSPELQAFYDKPAHEVDGETRNWYVRGQNFVLAYTEAAAGAMFTRKDQVDEYVLLIEQEDCPVKIKWNGETTELPGFCVVMIPPGDSSIELPKGGRVTRLFTSRSEDLVARCPNAANYASPKPHVAPFEPWPNPTGGWKVRSYDLNIPPAPGGFARMYRCTNFMINVFQVFKGPRDPKRMSPHSHDDFEQCSLALKGDWVHSLRWNWGTDMSEWREDEHVKIGAPSVMVIPATVIHSSRWVSEGENQLVDIFCPPRVDFSKIDGWVLNADDYPMPEGS